MYTEVTHVYTRRFFFVPTLYHVAGILWPPLGVVVVGIICLRTLQSLEDLWPYQAELRLLSIMIQHNKCVLNLQDKNYVRL